MIDITSTEFFVIAFAVAIAIVAFMFGRSNPGKTTTQVTALALNPSETNDEGLIVLKNQDDGSVLVLRNAIPLDQGDTVNLVVTAVGNHLTIVEKKGVQSRTAVDFVADGTGLIDHLVADRFNVRYDSEITGQWALFTFNNRDGRTATTHLKF